MEFSAWFTNHWFTLLQSVGIVGSFWFTAKSFRFDANVRRVGNYFAIAEQHGRIWSQVYSNPRLSRILETGPDLNKDPITVEEELFVTQLLVIISKA